MGAVLSVVARHLMQILNGSYSTIIYMNALKSNYPGQTHLPQKLRTEPPFSIYKDILCIWREGKKKVLQKKIKSPTPAFN